MGQVLGLGKVVQHEGHEHGGTHIRTLRPGRAAEHGVLRVYLPADVLQLCAQALHRQGLEHIADDVILYGLLGVLEVVMPAQEGDVRGRAHLAHLARQLNP